MFDVERFHQLRRGKFGSSLQYFAEIDSTNIFAMELARQRVSEGTVVLADSQTSGRGRNSHAWYSPAGLNLYFTLVLYPSSERLHFLPFIISLGIAEELDRPGLICDLKWPNDILVDERKIAGILIQTAIEENRLQYAVVGIGINVNTFTFPKELEATAVSIAQCTGSQLEREPLLAQVLWKIEQSYFMPLKWQELITLVKEKSSFFDGCRVQIEQQGKIISGTTAGVDPLGGLILETEEGREIFYAGEIQSCRKK